MTLTNDLMERARTKTIEMIKGRGHAISTSYSWSEIEKDIAEINRLVQEIKAIDAMTDSQLDMFRPGQRH